MLSIKSLHRFAGIALYKTLFLRFYAYEILLSFDACHFICRYYSKL